MSFLYLLSVIVKIQNGVKGTLVQFFQLWTFHRSFLKEHLIGF